MSSEELAHDSLFTTISGPLSDDELARYFSRRSDLTYRRIENVKVSEADMYMSLLTGSLIRDCVFSKVLLTRSDLDGIRAEKTAFVDCDFTSTDLRSCVFVGCSFESCIFDGSFIDDCWFQECELTNCIFRSSTLSHCDFRGSTFRAGQITRASFLTSNLHNCSIANVNLGDCTINYIILRSCELVDVNISAEYIGGIFGITREQLDQFNMSYMGEQQPIPEDTDLVKSIYEQYWQRKWYLGQLVLNLNFNLVSTLAAFDEYMSQSYKRFAELGFIKGEELEFVGNILEELASLNRLPLLTAFNVLDWCSSLEAAVKQRDEEFPKSSSVLFRAFVSRVVLLSNSLMDKLDQAMPEIGLEEGDRPLCVEVRFDLKPEFSLPDMLNSINRSSALAVAQPSRLIEARNGSYIEIVLTTLFSIIALQTFLYLINGCVIQLTELKQRIKTLARKRAPQSYVQLAISNKQHASPLILSVLPSLLAHAKGLGWLKAPSLGGYLGTNVKSLCEVDCGDVSSVRDMKRSSPKGSTK
jgi:uncharacterized protein YjbI with pentapeptide repeats